MPSYYVLHPNLKHKAVVEAPDTEKARTTYLDWLERTGKISRKWRQQLRGNMVAEKLEDPNEVWDVDVHLHYDFTSGEPDQVMSLSRPSVEEYMPGPQYSEYPEYLEPEMELEPELEPEYVEPEFEPVVEEELTRRRSPIEVVSLGG